MNQSVPAASSSVGFFTDDLSTELTPKQLRDMYKQHRSGKRTKTRDEYHAEILGIMQNLGVYPLPLQVETMQTCADVLSVHNNSLTGKVSAEKLVAVGQKFTDLKAKLQAATAPANNELAS